MRGIELKLARPLTLAETERVYAACNNAKVSERAGAGYLHLDGPGPRYFPKKKPKKPVYLTYGTGAGRVIAKNGKPFLYVVGCKGNSKAGEHHAIPLTADADNEVRWMAHLLNEFERGVRMVRIVPKPK